MKRSIQKGFTLIELMIVVAIIGILAAVALPAYQDYTTKSKISEASSLVAVAKQNIVLAFNDGSLHTTSIDNASLGLAAAGSITGKYVTSVTAASVSATVGNITVVVRGTGDTTVDSKTVIYTVTCVAGGSCQTTIDAASTVPTKFLPKV